MIFWLVMTPFILQGLAFGVDEFVFHHRRGLPKWERLGHPLDTATIVAPLLWAFSRPFSTQSLIVFAVMALVSCLFVTKDEFVHAKHCEPEEQWLHSVLFVLHPLLFVSVGLLWYLESIGISLTPGGLGLTGMLKGQMIFLASVMTYQIVYWSFIWPRKQTRSTTKSIIRLATVGTERRMIQ